VQPGVRRFAVALVTGSTSRATVVDGDGGTAEVLVSPAAGL